MRSIKFLFLSAVVLSFAMMTYAQKTVTKGEYSEKWEADNYRVATIVENDGKDLSIIEGIDDSGLKYFQLFHANGNVEKINVMTASKPFDKDKQYIHINGVDYLIENSKIQETATIKNSDGSAFEVVFD